MKGIKIEIIDPINGIKFKINDKIPKKIAKSFLNKNKVKKVKIPVRKLVKVFN